jgi:hypothetical protein
MSILLVSSGSFSFLTQLPFNYSGAPWKRTQTNKQTNNFSLFLAIKGGKDSLSIFTAASFSLWFQAKGWNNY